jgi:glycosyltransferase involved in cell wall biosynthesis
MDLKSVCLIASGMDGRNWRLQPWRYLTEVACQLAEIGHPVTALTDARESVSVEMLKCQVKVQRLPSVKNPVWNPNRSLVDAIREAAPEVIIWHLGLTSFLYQVIPGNVDIPIIGLFSNPVYHPRDLTRLGISKLIRNFRFIKVHLAGSLVTNRLLRAISPEKKLHSWGVQTMTTRKALERLGLRLRPIHVIPPGIDKIWSERDQHDLAAVRSSWGVNPKDIILLYYGSPAELRGAPTLIRAMAEAQQNVQNLKLVILYRLKTNEWAREEQIARDLIGGHHLEPHVKIIRGFLEPSVLVRQVAAADIIALPFELLPSDAPLSLLEAQAMGKPVVTTRVACLPELVKNGKGYIAEPSDPGSLAETIVQAVEELLADQEETHPCSDKSLTRSWQEVGMEWSHYLQNL